MAGKAWTKEEREFIVSHYATMSCEEMAGHLPGRTKRSVQHEFANLGLERSKPKVSDEFGRYTIREITEEWTGTQHRSLARVWCKCGQEKVVRLTALVQGRIVSCGCWKAEKASERMTAANLTHGMSQTRLYRIWAAVKTRCTNENTQCAKNYVGRGISMCDEWVNSFEAFRDWALVNGYQDDLEIDRRNNDGGYEPDNCRWATDTVQSNNKRTNHLMTAFGETKTIMEWLRDERCVVSNYLTLFSRITKLGWEPELAISTPTGLQGIRST